MLRTMFSAKTLLDGPENGRMYSDRGTNASANRLLQMSQRRMVFNRQDEYRVNGRGLWRVTVVGIRPF